MKLYGLIGYPLSHSFSRKYFSEKFEKEAIKNCDYQLFPIENIEELPDLISKHPTLQGLNVTIPYKQQVQKYLQKVDSRADKIGAVNVIKINQGKLTGYNSDYFGFRESLLEFMGDSNNIKALVLGTGGAAKAVKVVLQDLGIPFLEVSRQKKEQVITYQYLQENKALLQTHQLIINTTPLGMSPKVDASPAINYSELTNQHLLYDLVYNPEETRFMLLGKKAGAKVKNGLEMLYLQAEKSWEIWNS
jgi:shikimate dehydrogenase